MTAEERAQQIIDALNNFGSITPVAEAIARTHPTLQQSFMRLAFEFIKIQSAKTNYDLRNEASVKLSKIILDAVPYEDQRIPMI